MKQIKVVFVTTCIAALTACSGGASKKVIVMASGKLTVDQKNIKIDPGFTHNEQELIFKDDKVTLNVESTNGTKKSFDLTDNGVYLLNLQVDTLIGGAVNYGTLGVAGSITSEALDHIIDSTQQLMAGKNASEASKTFFLPPFTLQKVSAQNSAKVISSFKPIPYKVEADDKGEIPEVIKFFTNKQKRETLNELLIQREKIKSIH